MGMQRGLEGEALPSRVNGAPRAMNTEREEESEGGAKRLGEDLSRYPAGGQCLRVAWPNAEAGVTSRMATARRQVMVAPFP
jgi:hypothetical protein